MCTNKANQFIEVIKDHLIAAHYFNTTTDEFINSTRSVYFNVLAENSVKFIKKLEEKLPKLDESKHKVLLEKVIDSTDDYLCYILKYIEDYAGEDIFKVPRYVELEQDKEINETLSKYSIEENDEIDRQLNAVRERIEQKKSFIKCLRKRSEVLKMLDMSLNKNE